MFCSDVDLTDHAFDVLRARIDGCRRFFNLTYVYPLASQNEVLVFYKCAF